MSMSVWIIIIYANKIWIYPMVKTLFSCFIHVVSTQISTCICAWTQINIEKCQQTFQISAMVCKFGL